MLPAAAGFRGQAGVLNRLCIFLSMQCFAGITAPEDRV